MSLPTKKQDLLESDSNFILLTTASAEPQVMSPYTYHIH